MIKFYLTIHRARWLAELEVHSFLSRHHLERRRSLPRARCGWAMDSRGFKELELYGAYTISPEQYIDLIRRCDSEIGMLEWAASMDHMCEEHILAITAAHDAARTGRYRSLEYQKHLHLIRTVENFARLRYLWYERTDDECPIMPTLQGWLPEDYLLCWQLYLAAGIDLREYELVGLGSVCRRNRDCVSEVGEIISAVRENIDDELPLHGFGLKTQVLKRFGDQLETADSMAWSFNARHNPPMEGCEGHQTCSNCQRWALAWRTKLLDLPAGQYKPFELGLQREQHEIAEMRRSETLAA